MNLCEDILGEPDVHSSSRTYAYAHVLVLPPIDYFFDGDVQSLLGFHTLFYCLAPENDDVPLRKLKITVTANATFEHVFAKCVRDWNFPISASCSYQFLPY